MAKPFLSPPLLLQSYYNPPPTTTTTTTTTDQRHGYEKHKALSVRPAHQTDQTARVLRKILNRVPQTDEYQQLQSVAIKPCNLVWDTTDRYLATSDGGDLAQSSFAVPLHLVHLKCGMSSSTNHGPSMIGKPRLVAKPTFVAITTLLSLVLLPFRIRMAQHNYHNKSIGNAER